MLAQALEAQRTPKRSAPLWKVIPEERGSVLECSRPLELSIEALDPLQQKTPSKATPSPQAREPIARPSAGGPAHSKTLRAFVEVITDERGSVLECSRPLELSVEALDCPPRILFPKATPSSQAIKSRPHERQTGAPMPSHSGISHGVKSQALKNAEVKMEPLQPPADLRKKANFNLAAADAHV